MWSQLTAGGIVLAAMGAVVLIAAIIVWSALRAASRAGAAEANADTAKRQVEAITQAQEVKDERLTRMADAAAASVSESAGGVRKRMRQRRADTP